MVNMSLGLQNNTTGKNNTPVQEDTIYQYPIYQTTALVITWIELILMLVLNGVVITGILWRHRRNRLSFFVLHLAFTDFGLGLFYLLPDAVTRTTGEWYAGKTVCVIYQYISHVMPYVSSFMLVVISLDRLYVILQPLKSSRRGKRYRYTLVSVSWIIAMLLAIPHPIYAVLYEYNGKVHCDLHYGTAGIMEIAVVLFVCGVMFVPATIIFICYSLIVYTIWVRINKGMHIAPAKVRNSIESALGSIVISEYKVRKADSDQLKNNSGADIMTRAKIKSIIMTFVVVTVFVICWSPFCFNLLLVVYNAIPGGPYYYILMALAPLNSAANPIVFMAFNFRTLQRTSRRHRPNGTSTTTSSYFSKSGMLMRRVAKDEYVQ